jgi:hypothetical protein
MGRRTLVQLLVAAGILLLVGAIGWWLTFYGQVGSFIGAKGPPPLECLYSVSGPCRIISNVAGLFGAGAYNPLIFWGGCFLLLMGFFISLNGNSSESDKDTREMRSRQNRIEPRL